MDADEVLPGLMMSVATSACGAPSFCAMASMIRRLAWCGTNAASSPGVHAGALAGLQGDRVQGRGRPAEHGLALLEDERAAVLDVDLVRHAAVAAPDDRPDPGGCLRVASRADHRGPAPSAKMMQVDRSVQSTHWESFSAPMTSTCRPVPARTASLAVASA